MPLEPFKLERYFAQYEFNAKYMLSSSDAESIHLSELLDLEPAVRDSLGTTWLGYSESNGIPELRREIAKTYSTISENQVLLHTGAQEPIFNLMHSMLNPGDHVIAHFPSYQSFYSVPQSLGCEVSFWTARFENQWKLDLDELEKLIRPNTKLVLVNAPHNPTGFIFKPEEQKRLIEILRQREIYLLSDEVYRGLEIRSEDQLPAGCDLYEKAISLGVLSKAYGLAGLRLGWIATHDRDVYEKMAQFKDYTTICNPILSEKLGVIAIRHREKLFKRNLDIVQSNLKLADSFFEKNGDRFEWVRPLGGTMAFPRAKDGFNMEKFSAKLVHEKSVMLLPGTCFDLDATYFRLGLGRKNFPEAFEIFTDDIL